jgi:hypothetical protein
METPQRDSSISYPVTLELQLEERFERMQLLLRLLVCMAIGVLHQSMGGIFGALYLLLPVVVAILISRKGGAGFLDEDSHWLVLSLEWVIGLYAYLLFVTDRFPLPSQPRHARLIVQPTGTPSVGHALARLLLSIPHAFVLAILGLVSGIVWLLAAVMILFTERYPSGLHAFQRKYVAWMARFFVYHASLVEAYPPFSFDDHRRTPPARLPESFGAHGSAS